MHFPPVFDDEICEGLIEILKKYEIKTLYYGHIHGNYTIPEKIVYDGITMHIVSADYLSFTPKRVFPD